MQNQYIKEMLNIPELHIKQIVPIRTDEIHIEAIPIAFKQACPLCQSEEYVIRKGTNAPRIIRHLPAFGKKVFIVVPTIRLMCSSCEVGFVWSYSFVDPKRQYSHLFRQQAAEQAYGSTAAHSAFMQQAPSRTLGQMHNEAIPAESERLSQLAWQQALTSVGLVFGIDDFAIRKGHTYNTGIHDLRGETMLDLIMIDANLLTLYRFYLLQ